MSDSEAPKRLTPEDPVPQEVLAEFNRYEEARIGLGSQLLQLEQNKVKILAAAHRVDELQRGLFEKVLLERGLPATTQVNIDSKTGQLTVVGTPTPAEESDPAV